MVNEGPKPSVTNAIEQAGGKGTQPAEADNAYSP